MSPAVKAWAEARGLTFKDEGLLGEVTPSLVDDGGGSTDIVEGKLPGGESGRLAHHRRGRGPGADEITAVLVEVPQVVAFAPSIICASRDRGGRRHKELPLEKWEAVELESVEFGRRFDVRVLQGEDAGWMRELFTPEFIRYLSEDVPTGLGFELNDRWLCISVPGTLVSEADLDELCTAAGRIATRLRDEAGEEDEDPDLFRRDELNVALDKAVDEVHFTSCPESVAAAVTRYRMKAARRPSVLLSATAAAMLPTAIVAVIISASSPVKALIAAAIIFGVGWPLAQYVYSARYTFGDVGISRAGLEAFVREYAKARKLKPEDRRAFHASHQNLAMPGVAEHVLDGVLPGTKASGKLIFFGDDAEMRVHGQEVVFMTAHPLAATGALFTFGSAIPADLVEKLELPETMTASAHDRCLLVYSGLTGNLLRTAKLNDRFCGRAGEVHAQAEKLV